VSDRKQELTELAARWALRNSEAFEDAVDLLDSDPELADENRDQWDEFSETHGDRAQPALEMARNYVAKRGSKGQHRADRPEMRVWRVQGKDRFFLHVEGVELQLTYAQLCDEKQWRRELARLHHQPYWEPEPGEWAGLVNALVVQAGEEQSQDGDALEVLKAWVRRAPVQRGDRTTRRWFDAARRRYVFKADAAIEVLQAAGFEVSKKGIGELCKELGGSGTNIRDSAGTHWVQIVPGRKLTRSA
jgi:hypothetical protein